MGGDFKKVRGAWNWDPRYLDSGCRSTGSERDRERASSWERPMLERSLEGSTESHQPQEERDATTSGGDWPQYGWQQPVSFLELHADKD
jgi:hypothetical protein